MRTLLDRAWAAAANLLWFVLVFSVAYLAFCGVLDLVQGVTR